MGIIAVAVTYIIPARNYPRCSAPPWVVLPLPSVATNNLACGFAGSGRKPEQRGLLKRQGGGPLGEIGQGAFLDRAVLAPAFTQEDGGWGGAIGDRFYVHGNGNACNKSNTCIINYLGTIISLTYTESPCESTT